MDISNFFTDVEKFLKELVEEEVVKMTDEEINEIREKYKNRKNS